MVSYSIKDCRYFVLFVKDHRCDVLPNERPPLWCSFYDKSPLWSPSLLNTAAMVSYSIKDRRYFVLFIKDHRCDVLPKERPPLWCSFYDKLPLCGVIPCERTPVWSPSLWETAVRVSFSMQDHRCYVLPNERPLSWCTFYDKLPLGCSFFMNNIRCDVLTFFIRPPM